jgi:release factor glutamine methyltransferase
VTVAGVGVTRAALVAELATVVGAPHEARFIVDEALGLGLVLGHPRVPSGPLPPDAVEAARAMARRRADGEPLQYVFGHWPFRTLDLVVDPRVLIPRPETEQVVEVALAEARRLAAAQERRSPAEPGRRGLVVVDAGTGSGAIALSLAVELGPNLVHEVWATDASTDALAVVAANLDAVHDAARPLPDVTLARGDWLDPLPGAQRGRVDLVVSNPPYVSEEEWAELEPEVRCEPRAALVAGPGRDGTPGLADVEAVLAQASTWLGATGAVVVELAPHQAEAGAASARRAGFDDVALTRDLTGRLRALVARRGGAPGAEG